MRARSVPLADDVGTLIGRRFASHNLQNCQYDYKMPVMADIIRLPDELGLAIQQRRKALRMSKTDLAERSGKVREVIYRLEAGEDTTVSSLMAVLAALGLGLRVEAAGLPSAQEVAARFQDDDDAP